MDLDKEKQKEFDPSFIAQEVLLANSNLVSNMPFDKAEENINLVFGNHWYNVDTREKFFMNERTPVSMPVLFPKVMSLLGQEKNNRKQFEAEPMGKEDELLAQIYNAEFRSTENQDDPKKYCYTKSDIFLDACVPCFGALEIYHETNPEGNEEVKLRQIPYNQIAFDNNFTDQEMTGCSRWQNYYDVYLDDLALIYSEKELLLKNIDEDFGNSFWRDVQQIQDNKSKFLYDSTIYPGKKRVRYIRDWLKTTRTYYRVFDVEKKELFEYETKAEAEGKKKEIEKERNKIVNMLKNVVNALSGQKPKIPDSEVIITPFPKEVIQYTVVAGTVLLEEPTILEVEDSPIKILFGIFINGRYLPIVSLVRDLALYVDRLFAQLDYNIGTDSKTGGEVNVDILDNSINEFDDLKTIYSKGGLMAKHGDGRLINTMQKNVTNPAYFEVFKILFEMIEDTFGGRNLQGSKEGGGNESGKVFQQRVAVAQVMTLNLFDNLERFEAQVGQTLIKYIKQYYTYEHTLRVLGEDLTDNIKQEMQKQHLYEESLMHDGIGYLIVNQGDFYKKRPMSNAKLNIILKKSSTRMDEKEMQFAQMKAIAEMGYTVPLPALLDTMNLKATTKQQFLQADEERQKKEAEAMELQKKQLEFKGNLEHQKAIASGYDTLNKNKPEEQPVKAEVK